MTGRGHKINFNAGPAALPPEVLQQASEAILDYNGSGLSILEIPHRGKQFDAILEESKQLVKDLCWLNDDHEILWMHGGGRLQFCMIPMNFLGKEEKAGYIDSGSWAADAYNTAKYYGQAELLASSKDQQYKCLPEWPLNIPSGLNYIHFTTNNTIEGTQWSSVPKVSVPLIADMSSDIFSVKRDYTNCAMFYAVAQKNIGPAGTTLLAVRKDMLERIQSHIPPMLNYKEHAKKNSVLNTPAVFPIYTSLLTLRWIKAKGIDSIEQENRKKAELLYGELDRNILFHCAVEPESRSMMNVCFTAINNERERAFIEYCEANDIVNVKGHRSVGGFRVSLYNAITISDVEKLVVLMQQFEKETGK